MGSGHRSLTRRRLKLLPKRVALSLSSHPHRCVLFTLLCEVAHHRAVVGIFRKTSSALVAEIWVDAKSPSEMEIKHELTFAFL